MKEKKPFKVGATYKLKKKYVGEFFRNFEICELFGNGVFEFTASAIEPEGVRCESYSLGVIAFDNERHMFKRIDNK